MAIQIIEERKKPTFGQKLGMGVGRGLEMGRQLLGEKQAIERETKEAELKRMHDIAKQREKYDFLTQLEETKRKPTEKELADIALANQKLKNLQQQESFYSQLGFGGQNQPEDIIQKPSQSQQQRGFGIMKTDEVAPSNQQNLQNRIAGMSDEQLRGLSGFAGQPGQQGIVGNIAQSVLDQRKYDEKIKREKFESERSYHTGFSKESSKEVEGIRTGIQKQKNALMFARNAIETGDASYFSPDKLADATGVDLFRTAKGAQLVTAGKENLLSNLSRVSSKGQNLWFEQRLNSMFPKIGQDNEANLTVLEMIEAENAIDEAYINEYDRLSQEDEKNFGFERKDIAKRARAAIKPMENHIMRRATYRMKEIEEVEKGLTELKKQIGKNVVKGTPLTFAMAKLYYEKFGKNALDVAEKNGYYIPTFEEWESYRATPNVFEE